MFKNHQVQDKAINGMNINLFLDYISKILEPNLDPSERKILLMDNLRVHHAKVIVSILQELGFEIRFFPAYIACDLSPLDNSFFHKLKSRFHDLQHFDPQTKENSII
ncbi:mariner mos1 transposase-like protein [Anaeramoeba ignava]|uniref:Mariner mos1 transposase-like protein n=1 Tax=Anaeramoeba ignava TaxID=1746090 RepID=A0A9Q0LTW3_ANAIG|nr:mariner mos1 transposase-like protein [Anaeramoeba ignava]